MISVPGEISGTRPLLISRITELSPLSTRSALDSSTAALPMRKGSLNHFWASFNAEVKAARASLADSIDLDYLDVRNAEWISAVATFRDGVMAIAHASDPPFATVDLAGARIVGHMAKPCIQVITSSQTFLLHLGTHEANVRCLATLLAWSETRGSGLAAKMWVPALEPAEDASELLVCKFNVHFTAPHSTNSSSWQCVVGTLSKAGVLSLALEKGETFSLDITQVHADCIRRVDPSLVSSEWVIFIVPDMGGPESVYIKLSSDNDFEDWFVCLRSFCRQTVYTDLARDPRASVRFNHVVKVTIMSAKVKGGDAEQELFDFSDTYVDVCFNDWIWARTSVHPATREPFWGQEFVFKELDRDLAPLELVLRRTSADRPSELDSFLAKVLLDDVDGERWVTLESEADAQPLSLYIAVEHLRTPVLDASFYQPLQQLLRDPANLGVGSELIQSASKQLVPACAVFTDIYRGQCMHTEWIAALVSREVKRLALDTSSASADVLFRGSSLLSQALEKFMFLYGRETLSKTVGRFVRKISASKEHLELDPARLAGTDVEVAAAARANRLAFEHYLTYLWTLIKNFSLPETFQYLLTHLRKELVAAGATETQAYHGLAAFIFLRFYCPALLSPRLFGLADQVLDAGHQRALTLFAKTLQSFANRVRLGSKQEWLMPMNKFFDAHDGELVAYYKQISGWTQDMPLARVPKQLPLRAFMGAQLTNPYLVDLSAGYARLAGYVAANLEFDRAWGGPARAVYEECKRLHNLATDVCAALDGPDPLPPQTPARCDVTLYANWTSMLYSPEPELLEAHYIKQPEKRSMFRLFRRG